MPGTYQGQTLPAAALAASIAAGIPVSTSDALTGIDHCNASLLAAAILHENGQ
jgi:hypothetical protein